MVEGVAEPAEGAGAARRVGESVPREEPRGEDEGADADGRGRAQQRAEAHPHRAAATGSEPGLPPPAPDTARARWTVLSSRWQEWRGRCLGVRGGHLKERRDQNEEKGILLQNCENYPKRNYQPWSQRKPRTT